MDRIKDRLNDLLSFLMKLVPRGVEIYNSNKMTAYSGYATLMVVTAAIPFLILIISVINLLPGYSVNDALDVLFKVIPDLESFRDLIKSIVTELKDQSGGLVAVIAAVTALWYASKGISAIKEGLDQLDNSEQNQETNTETKTVIVKSAISFIQSIIKRMLFTMLLIILIPAFLIFQILGDSLVELIWSILEKIEPDILNTTLEFIDDIFDISSLLVIPFSFLVILLIYAVLPAAGKTFKSQLPGALIACLCWTACTALFAFIIPHFWNAASLYGPLASVFLVLMWLNAMVIILFVGAVINHALIEQHQNEKSD